MSSHDSEGTEVNQTDPLEILKSLRPGSDHAWGDPSIPLENMAFELQDVTASADAKEALFKLHRGEALTVEDYAAFGRLNFMAHVSGFQPLVPLIPGRAPWLLPEISRLLEQPWNIVTSNDR